MSVTCNRGRIRAAMIALRGIVIRISAIFLGAGMMAALICLLKLADGTRYPLEIP